MYIYDKQDLQFKKIVTSPFCYHKSTGNANKNHKFNFATNSLLITNYVHVGPLTDIFSYKCVYPNIRVERHPAKKSVIS